MSLAGITQSTAPPKENSTLSEARGNGAGGSIHDQDPYRSDTILIGAVYRGEGVGDAVVLGTGSGPGSAPS
jgi:hypothetical protein